MSKLLKLVLKLGLFTGGIGMIIAYANLSDLNGWKQALKQHVMTVMGRQISIDGPIRFDLTFPPRIVAKNVRIQNASWGSKPDMLNAQTLIAEVDLLPLMMGRVAVPRVQLAGVDILVEINGDGLSNWDDLNNFDTAAGPAPAPVSGPGFPSISPILGSQSVGLNGGTFTVSSLSSGVSNTLVLPPSTFSLGGQQLTVFNPCL